jgi:hypothetical protein
MSVNLDSLPWPSAPATNYPFKGEVTFGVRGVISPLLSELYLIDVARMLERAKETTRFYWVGFTLVPGLEATPSLLATRNPV